MDAVLYNSQLFVTYQRLAGVAVMVLFLQVVKYLKNSRSRVDLLEYTLRLAMPTIMIYIM